MRGVSMLTMARAVWAVVRYAVVVPLLQLAVYLCAAMSLMLFAERLYMGLVVAVLWLSRRRRQRRNPSRNKGGDDDDDDLESGGAEDLPMFLVQIPMFNEKQVSTYSMIDCSSMMDDMICMTTLMAVSCCTHDPSLVCTAACEQCTTSCLLFKPTGPASCVPFLVDRGALLLPRFQLGRRGLLFVAAAERVRH